MGGTAQVLQFVRPGESSVAGGPPAPLRADEILRSADQIEGMRVHIIAVQRGGGGQPVVVSGAAGSPLCRAGAWPDPLAGDVVLVTGGSGQYNGVCPQDHQKPAGESGAKLDLSNAGLNAWLLDKGLTLWACTGGCGAEAMYTSASTACVAHNM